MPTNQQEQDVLTQLRARLMQQGHQTLKEGYGSPRRGVSTGLDQAFVIDQATRDALVQQDPRSVEILKPFLASKDANKWYIEPQQWLIRTSSGTIDIEGYPAIKQHLLPFRAQLEQRDTTQKWFELLPGVPGEGESSGQMQIVCLQDRERPVFSLDRSGAYFANTGFSLPREDYFLLGVLNSKLQRFLLEGMSAVNGEALQILNEHIEALPFPMPLAEQRGMIGQSADHCQELALEQLGYHAYMRQEIASNLAPGGLPSELSARLNDWHLLDVVSFRDEVSRHFGQAIPEDMMPAWEKFLGDGKMEFSRIGRDIERAERQIDRAVYAMFGLTDEEIELLDRI